jgi:hypothetical protein
MFALNLYQLASPTYFTLIGKGKCMNAICYILFLKFLHPIAGIVVVLVINGPSSVNPSFIRNTNPEYGPTEYSEKANYMFSAGAENLFQVLKLIDNFADILFIVLAILIMVCCRSCCCSSLIIGSASLSNLCLSIFQCFAFYVFVTNSFTITSPSFIFMITLIIEALENFIDFICIFSIAFCYCCR